MTEVNVIIMRRLYSLCGMTGGVVGRGLGVRLGLGLVVLVPLGMGRGVTGMSGLGEGVATLDWGLGATVWVTWGAGVRYGLGVV